MSTFRDNVRRANKSGEGCINWEYHSLMNKYFGKKDSVKPKQSTLNESSLTNIKNSKCDIPPGFVTSRSLQNSKSTTHIEDSSDDELKEVMPKIKKKKTFQEMLLEEMKEDRKFRNDFQKELEDFMDMLIKIETAKLEKFNK